MMKEVFLRGLPKNVDEATIQTWYYEEGDRVNEGDEIAEVASGEETYTVQAAATGVLAEVYFDEGDTVSSGELLCMIDDEEDFDEEEEEEEKEDEEDADEEPEDEEDTEEDPDEKDRDDDVEEEEEDL